MTPGLSVLAVLLGLFLVAATLHDFLTTVLTVTGGGPLTERLNSMVWRVMRRFHRRWPSHGRLSWVGPVLAGLTLLLWAAMLWLGWTLIFSGPTFAVLDAKTGQPADLISRAYYTGFTLTTLGVGDYTPGTPSAKIATVLAGANGLLLFTMAITYIVPVVSAAAQKRSLAAYVAGLGAGPAPLLTRAWDGQGFGAASPHLTALVPMITAITQQHLTYPILHYFHSPERETALPVQLAVLDEALMALACGVESGTRPHTLEIDPVRHALAHFLGTLDSAYISPADHPPPSTPLMALRAAAIPTVDDAEYERAVAGCAERRRLLRGLIEEDGWSWSQVVNADAGEGGAPGRGSS